MRSPLAASTFLTLVAAPVAQDPVAEAADTYRVSAALGDVDGDGHADLVVGRNGAFGVCAGTAQAGGPRFGPERRLDIAVHPSCEITGQPQLVDFDGDGDLDLLALDQPLGGTERLLWFRNDGKGGFAEAAPVRAANGAALIWSGPVRSAVIADVDGDGHRDLVVAARRVLWFAGVPGGFAADASEIDVASQGAIALVDTRGAGRPDLVAVVDGALVAYRRIDAGWERPVQLALVEGDAGQATLGVGDWDGDGTVDLLLGETRALPPAPAPTRTAEDETRLAAARNVMAAIQAERARLDRSRPPIGDPEAMARRQAQRAELQRWAEGPLAVVEALSDPPATRFASRVRFVRGLR